MTKYDHVVYLTCNDHDYDFEWLLFNKVGVSDGSGYGFGGRDLDWDFKTKGEAKRFEVKLRKALKHLRSKNRRGTVPVGISVRYSFDGKEE
jgi:hypothetical protein